jgi:hypothetical protein
MPLIMKNSNHFLLTSLLLLLILGGPIYELNFLPQTFFEYLFIFILFASSIIHKAGSMALKVNIICLLGVISYHLFMGIGASIPTSILKLIIISLAIMHFAKDLINSKTINNNMVSGSVAIYLLIGVFWCELYIALLLMDGQAFSNIAILDESLKLEMLYFSFVTLTTLGYGDIVPVSTTARFWSVTEAMIGVLFLAVLIGRIVSLLGKKDN